MKEITFKRFSNYSMIYIDNELVGKIHLREKGDRYIITLINEYMWLILLMKAEFLISFLKLSLAESHLLSTYNSVSKSIEI